MVADCIIRVLVAAPQLCGKIGPRRHLVVEHVVAQPLRASDVGPGLGEPNFQAADPAINFPRAPTWGNTKPRNALTGCGSEHQEPLRERTGPGAARPTLPISMRIQLHPDVATLSRRGLASKAASVHLRLTISI